MPEKNCSCGGGESAHRANSKRPSERPAVPKNSEPTTPIRPVSTAAAKIPAAVHAPNRVAGKYHQPKGAGNAKGNPTCSAHNKTKRARNVAAHRNQPSNTLLAMVFKMMRAISVLVIGRVARNCAI